MLGNELETESVFARCRDLFFYVIAVRCEFIAQLSANIHRLVVILDNLNSSENYDTLDIERPFTFATITAVINAEGCLVARPERIDLVSRFAAVKVDMTVFLAVTVIDRTPKGYPLSPINESTPRGSFFRISLHSSSVSACFFLTNSLNII